MKKYICLYFSTDEKNLEWKTHIYYETLMDKRDYKEINPFIVIQLNTFFQIIAINIKQFCNTIIESSNRSSQFF